MRMPSDQTFLDHWTTWLATDAPRRLEEATVVEYKRQLVAFARWMEMPFAISSTPESSTSQARVIRRSSLCRRTQPRCYQKWRAVWQIYDQFGAGVRSSRLQHDGGEAGATARS
jgi:hypothetical protein